MKRIILALAMAASLVSGSAAVAGAIGGPAFVWREVVGAYQWIEYRVAFRGGEWTTISVVGLTPGNLDLYVLDEFGNVIAADITYVDNVCQVTFYAAYPRVYTIRVVNRTARASLFDILTN